MTEHSPGRWKAQFEYYPNDGEYISAEVNDISEVYNEMPEGKAWVCSDCYCE